MKRTGNSTFRYVFKLWARVILRVGLKSKWQVHETFEFDFPKWPKGQNQGHLHTALFVAYNFYTGNFFRKRHQSIVSETFSLTLKTPKESCGPIILSHI